MPSVKGRARLFDVERPQKDIDPEAEFQDDDSSSDGDSDASGPKDFNDTEHYVSVGRSKLRQPNISELGPAYRSVRISRKQLEQESDSEDEEEEEDDDDDDDDEDEDDEDEDEEFDDPDEVDIAGAEEVDDSEDEIDSDDALGADDGELLKKFVFRGSSKPNDIEGDEDEDDEDEDNEDDEEESGEDEDEDGEESIALPVRSKEEKRRELADGRKKMLAPLSQAAKEEVDKGRAIRQQRRTFDEILKMRLRLQKALSSANSLHVVAQQEAEDGEEEEAGGAITVATSKAIELLTAIQNIRQSFYLQDDGASAGKKKRKRPAKTEADVDRSCQGIFNDMAEMEKAAVAKRRRVLDQWSSRAQTKTIDGSKKKASSSSSSSSFVTNALDARLDEDGVDRWVTRSRTPRKCAPLQLARQVKEDPEIYDDTDFYEVLLRELVDQRSADAFAPGNSAATVRWAASAAREARTRKQVDRRASKGRRMRYNEHEKLENFGTAVDLSEWEQERTAWFFGSLFGQQMTLRGDNDGAKDDADDDDEDSDGVDLEGDSFKLLRS